jgi:apolipoprotein N-acyltransferase
MAIGESKKEVRTTWIGFAVIFGTLGAILWWRERASFPYLLGASGFFAIFALFAPMALLPLYRLWVKFAMGMAWVNTRILLCMVFYLMITPIAVFMRVLGKDPLGRKIDKNAITYWKKREPSHDLSRYEKQY